VVEPTGEVYSEEQRSRDEGNPRPSPRPRRLFDRKAAFWEGRTGGADGIRTHDLLDAIEARSQLRHGPTVKKKPQLL
jgi:hypothetical protein